jgi:hypothetical protein
MLQHLPLLLTISTMALLPSMLVVLTASQVARLQLPAAAASAATAAGAALRARLCTLAGVTQQHTSSSSWNLFEQAAAAAAALALQRQQQQLHPQRSAGAWKL